jgi:hypothetical protein
MGKAEQKPQSLIRQSLPAAGLQLKCTPADPSKKCWVASSVVWIIGFNSK